MESRAKNEQNWIDQRSNVNDSLEVPISAYSTARPGGNEEILQANREDLEN